MTRRALAERLLSTRAVLPRALCRRLDQPVRPLAIVLGWIGSTILFLLVATGLGGPTEGDSSEVVYGTWAVAHAHLSCVYPVVAKNLPLGLADPFALAAPLYPLLSGLLAAVLRIGHAVPFPGTSALGPSCTHGFVAMYHWSVHASAIEPTVRLGFATWAVLLAGLVALVRTTPIARTGWEVAAGCLLALSPPVVMCLTYYFHPQDLLAMGLVLLATAAVVRERFLLGGVLLGLALTAQQFAILAAAVLVVLVGRRGLVRLVGGALASVVVVDGTFVAASGLRAVKTVLLGSSRVGADIAAHGGTVLFSAGLRGVPDFLTARVAPILAAALVAWWVRRRCGDRALNPAVVLATLSAGLLARLVFEVNLFGYYFMAALVGVALVEAVRGQVGRDVLAFYGLFAVELNPEHIALVSNLTSWGLSLYYDLPIVVGALGVVVLLYDALRRRNPLGDALWVAFVALAGETHLWHRYNPIWNLPEWCWQIVLVGYAVVIVGRRLRGAARVAKPADELVEAAA